MQRNARQPFVFSDGTVIPVGAKLVAPSLTLQRDATVLDDPDTFDGFRWVKVVDGAPTLPKSMVTTGTDYHLFGHGRHPW
jgi:cytochrome P450